MRHSFKYSFQRKATWGIVVNIVAEYRPLPSAVANASRITEQVWLSIDIQPPLAPKEAFFLRVGLRMVADAIAATKPGSGPILVQVLRVDYNPTDYQPEGLACAIAGWASQVFGFPRPGIEVDFNKQKRRYVFSFETQEEVAPIAGKDASAVRQMVIDHLQHARDYFFENNFPAAAEKASVGVRYALMLLLSSTNASIARKAGPDDFETYKALLRAKARDGMPLDVGRHLSRIGTWHADLRSGSIALNSKHEVGEYIHSADRIAEWARSEAANE